MPILFYLLALRSENGAAFFANRFLPLVFQTYLAGVVVEELYAGALDGEAVHLVERYVGALERAGRVVAPNFQDWKDAGKIIARITRENLLLNRRLNRY